MLANDIPRLMAMIPQEVDYTSNKSDIQGGAFDVNRATSNPFASGACMGAQLGSESTRWVVEPEKPKFQKSGKYADIDRDGQLNQGEFALAMYLINIKLEDDDLPDELSVHLVPHSKYKEFFDFKDQKWTSQSLPFR